ncbi:MAG: protein kinase [Byssovorax sp.]
MASDGDKALIGRTIGGKYLIESFLGGGAMGAVWKARQVTLEKTVAIKILHRQLAGDDAFVARFNREARAASRLDHPNSIRVFDHGEEEDGLLYIAMEYCEGRDLHRVMTEDWPLSDDRAIDLLSQVLSALAVAHEMGVVHRDLKPENILVQDGVDDDGNPIDVVKVCDFGIATVAEPRSDTDQKGAVRSNITATGFIVGTPEYMSPEQARGEHVDARSDLYSAGVVLFRMLTGTLPFEAESAIGVAVKHIYEEPTHPSQVNLNVNERLASVCLKALQKDPKDRHQNAREMRSDLRGHRVTQTDIPALSERMPPRPRSIVDVQEATTQPSSRVPEVHPTLAGVPKPTPPSSPAPQTPPRQLARIAPLVALGLVFAGVALFKITRTPTPSTPISAGPTTAIEAPSLAPEARTAPTGALEPRAPDSTAPAVAGEAPSARAAAVSAAGVTGLSRSARTTPSAAAEASAPASAAPPTPTPTVVASVAAVEPPPPAVVVPPIVPTPAPTPEVPAFDPSTARVAVGGVSTTNGLTGGSVRSALARANFTGCYQTALRAAGAPSGGSVNLHLAIDDTGHVISATAAIGFLPGARSCVESAARSIRVSNVDTGDATADVALSFLPR